MWTVTYLEGVASSAVTGGRINNTKALAIDSIGASNSNHGTVRAHRGDSAEGKENRDEGSLGEHGNVI
jgi:hypothetical protein